SLYLEPLSTVEINNEIVALEEQEAEEVRRILLALTDTFRSRPLELQRTIEAATELDVLQARARFSQSIDGIVPRLSTHGAFERRCMRAASRASSAAQGARPCHPQNHSARNGIADHRSEHGRQNRGAENGRPSGADGAIRGDDSGGRRLAAAGVPIGVCRHRRRTID